MAEYWCEEEKIYKVGNGTYINPNYPIDLFWGASSNNPVWLLIAATGKNVKDTYNAGTHRGWIVLGAYFQEQEPYENFFNNHLEYKDDGRGEEYSGDEVDENYRVAEAKWEKFLLDEAVRLAEEKGLVPEETHLNVCKIDGDQELWGQGQETGKG
jgi:hypothetical protein